MTWRNERAVEISVAKDFLGRYSGEETLEVGNVSSHYFRIRHTVVDKYERKDNIVTDILEFQPKKRYRLIISISTLEHVGFDEQDQDPEKPLKAIRHLIENCLEPAGVFLATFPIGYNPSLDAALFNGQLPFQTIHYLKRVSKWNRWISASRNDVRNTQYGSPFIFGNAVAVCLIYEGNS